jgi:hypothetical protein
VDGRAVSAVVDAVAQAFERWMARYRQSPGGAGPALMPNKAVRGAEGHRKCTGMLKR